jgi:hypothetical protein
MTPDRYSSVALRRSGTVAKIPRPSFFGNGSIRKPSTLLGRRRGSRFSL